MRTITTVALGVLLVVAAGASAQDTKDGKKDKDAVDAKKLIGKWEPKDLPAGAKATVEFTKDGKLLINFTFGDKSDKVEGTYKVTKDEIEFTDEKGPLAEKAAGPGTYKWKLDGDKVTFTKVKDKSEGRSGALTAGAWERKKE